MSLLAAAKAAESKKNKDFKIVSQDLFDLVEGYLEGKINRTQATYALFGNLHHSGFDSIFKRTVEAGIRVGRYQLNVNKAVTSPNIKA